METTPTWLEVAHCAGSRFVFIVLPCTSLCNFSDTLLPPPSPPPPSHTSTTTSSSSSSALSCLSFFTSLGLDDPISDIFPPTYPALPPFLQPLPGVRGVPGRRCWRLTTSCQRKKWPAGALSVAQGAPEGRSSHDGRRSKKSRLRSALWQICGYGKHNY